jgi:hypothetical protein
MQAMSDYGHFGSVANGFAIDTWGAGPFTICDKDKQWSFEFSDRFGPLLLDRHGEPSKRQPVGARHPFWKPFNCWLSQGKQVQDGVAAWHEPLPMVLRQIVGRCYEIQQEGEEHGETILKPKDTPHE